MKLLFGFTLVFIKFTLLPSHNLMFWMGITIALDFLTGFSKAVVLQQARTSNGMRKTVTKFIQYGGALVVGVILAHAAQENAAESIRSTVTYFNDGLVVFIIYIEVTSIFENMVAIDNKSPMSRYFFTPVLKLLTAQFKNLPIVQAVDAATPQNQNPDIV